MHVSDVNLMVSHVSREQSTIFRTSSARVSPYHQDTLFNAFLQLWIIILH